MQATIQYTGLQTLGDLNSSRFSAVGAPVFRIRPRVAGNSYSAIMQKCCKNGNAPAAPEFMLKALRVVVFVCVLLQRYVMYAVIISWGLLYWTDHTIFYYTKKFLQI